MADTILEIQKHIEGLSGLIDQFYGEVVEAHKRGQPKKSLSFIVKDINQVLRAVCAKTHFMQFNVDWGLSPEPEWFDHYIDQFYQWHHLKNPLWIERGIFGLLAIKQDSDLLELCCGDGFNAYHYYSIRCKKIISVDFDPEVIEHAKRYNQAENIEYGIADIRHNMPKGKFNNIVWDAAIEHFTEQETSQIMQNIKDRLKPGGVLSGYTIKEKDSGNKSLSHHEYEFKSKEDLSRFFTSSFKNVKVFETIYPSRHNFYFYCSDGVLPFDKNWEHGLSIGS